MDGRVLLGLQQHCLWCTTLRSKVQGQAVRGWAAMYLLGQTHRMQVREQDAKLA